MILNMRILFLAAAPLLCRLLATAQLAVTVSPVKLTGQKAVVSLTMSNGLPQKVESARAAVFLLDSEGKMLAQETRWIIGGSKDKQGLPAGATNLFNFVLTPHSSVTTTNLTTRINFSRIVLEGGKQADPRSSVRVVSATGN
jgi:hypothetical protein